MKKSLTTIFCLISIAILCLGAWAYLEEHVYGSDTFAGGTVINGVDCSGMTVSEADSAIARAVNNRPIEIVEDGKTIGKITGLHLTYDISDQVRTYLHGTTLRTDVPGISVKGSSKDVTMTVSKMPDSTKEYLESFDFLDKKPTVITKDAYVDTSNREFKIVPEVYGDNIDKSRFVKAVLKHVENNETTIDYKAKDYYELPKLTTESREILDEQEFCKKYLSQEISYKFSSGEVTITPDELRSLINVDDKGKVTVNEEAVSDFVLKLAYKYNTVGVSRTFKATNGGTITVSGGSYGYLVNQEKEAEQLKKDIESGKDVSRELIYWQKPYVEGKDEIGNSYVEVDLSAQHVWLYKNGKVVVSTDVVTGNYPNHQTSTGVYGITYLQRDTKLKGQNDDGTDYESEVRYWMPFNGDQGLHDADWRRAFGGTIYKGGGSHGCVNMPVSAAEQVFGQVEKGFPVIVHN